MNMQAILSFELQKKPRLPRLLLYTKPFNELTERIDL
jgi:hypothetical protein